MALIYREWESEEHYLHYQTGKITFALERILEANEKRIRFFTERFKLFRPHMLKGGSILCLGARTGCEVIGSIKAGFPLSMGVDLQPVGPMVIKADWDHIPVADKSFGNVYSNSLDHCRDLPRLIQEVTRILQDNGVFIFDTPSKYALSPEERADMKKQFGRRPYNAMFWENDMDVCNEFLQRGYELKGAIVRESGWNVYFLRKIGKM